MSKRVITINRMLGSNGRLIGKALAEELGFAFYDKELIDIAAQKENIPFDLLARSLPLQILSKHKNELFQIEALLLVNPDF